MKLAFIAGSDLMSAGPFADATPIGGLATDDRATVFALQASQPSGLSKSDEPDQAYLLLRHGPDQSTPPHRIAHSEHMELLRTLGVEGIVSFCSVGSLNRHWGPGTLCLASDFINLTPVLTRFDHQAEHITPVLSEALRARLGAVLEGLDQAYEPEGVYWQTIGPRLETKAEIRMMSNFADVVGMTFGHEATLANEAGIPIAALCRIDNFGHGLVEDQRAGQRLVDEIRTAKRASVGFFAEVADRLIQEES